MTKPIFTLVCIFLLLTACTASPVTVVPATPTNTPGFQSTNTVQSSTTSIPTVTGIPSTDMPAAAGATPTPFPRLEAGLPVKLASIHMVDRETGWGIEKSGHIVRTRDGGDTWQDVTPPGGLYNAAGFFALDANTAWATLKPSDSCDASQMNWDQYLVCLPGPQVVIWRTMDGGETWQAGEPYQVEDQHYEPIDVQFIDASTGWFLYVSSLGPMGATTMGMAKTENGGVSWVRAVAPQNMCVHRVLAFLNTQDGWSGADCRFVPIDWLPLKDFLGGGIKLTLDRTSDGASLDWNTETLPSPKVFPAGLAASDANPNFEFACGMTSMERISPQAFTARWTCSMNHEASPETDFSYQYLTSDRGQSWHSWLATGNEFFLNAQRGWRLYTPREGQVSQLQQTMDGGRVWKTIKTVTWQSAQFDFVSEQVGWAILDGDDVSTLAHTVDGGRSWVDVHPMVSASLETQPHTAIFLGNLQRTGVYEANSAEIITGKLKWKRLLGRASASPAILDGKIYYGSMTIEISNTSTSTIIKFSAIDIDSGQVEWSFSPDLWWFTDAAPAVSDGTVYFNDIGDVGNGTTSCFYALDIVTGTEKWKACVAGYALKTSPAVSNGMVYLGGPVDFWALDAKTGQAKWVLATGILGSPALADGVVYFHASKDNEDYLYAVNADTGQEKWIFRMGPNYNYNWGDYTEGTPTVSNGMVYISGSDYLYAIDAQTGREQWKLEAGRDMDSVVADGKTIYFLSSSYPQHVYAVDAFTGKPIWKFNLGDSQQRYVSPSLSNNVLYIGTNTGLYALDARTGQEKWKYSEYEMVLDPEAISSPVIVDGVVYFARGDYLYAIE